MNLNLEQFRKAYDTVEEIVNKEGDFEIKPILICAGKDIPKQSKKEFYLHMNSLFLNVLVNRLTFLDKNAEVKAIESKMIISQIIKDIDDATIPFKIKKEKIVSETKTEKRSKMKNFFKILSLFKYVIFVPDAEEAKKILEFLLK